jgi:Ca-activated chloride channel family protein
VGDWASIEWVWPWAWLLLPLPLLLRRGLPPTRDPGPALRVPFFEDYAAATVDDDTGADEWTRHRFLRWSSRLLAGLIWLLLLLAAARPQWVGEPLSFPISGRDLMLAVDISGSMERPDLDQAGQQFTRLAAVKRVARRFIEERRGDRLGLILFGSQAYLQTPLTFDRRTVATLLAEAQIGLAGKETAIGDAIGLAIKRLRVGSGQTRVLVLLTDGTNTAGEVDPREAARMAAANGIRIYTVGIGADRRADRPTPELDEQVLRDIAATTGGEYFRARDVAGLTQVYTQLDALEPAVSEHRRMRPIVALYHWPLGLALVLSAVLGWRYAWS